ncbi:MAG: glycosyltransferase [Bacteroidota bacterium]|nr:glycosyltransferase [Bacteroidota bacterium]MDP4232646.1 glycosyltransferase [Bacteroidota bacterium]MDP4243898.1 glycosyltransferase [Bacteroidota bacterium]MDP4288433.1 glycosyltransferase [Bacteroidota bacterium]
MNGSHTGTPLNGFARNGHANGHSPKKRPRILFLSHRFPFPLIGGDRIKAYHLVRHLSTEAQVDLIALDEAHAATPETANALDAFANVRIVPFDHARALRRVVTHVISTTPIEFTYYNDRAMQQAVDEALAANEYDLIVCFFLRTAHFVRNHTRTPKLLVAEDARVILEERASQRFSLWRSPSDHAQYLIRKMDAIRLRSYEPRAMAKGFARITFVSKADEHRILMADPTLPTGIVSNGISLADNDFYDGPREDSLIFFGHLGTYHNILMARRLLKSVYPMIRQGSPSTKLAVVGKSPDPQIVKLVQHTSGATLFPDVKDMRPYLRRAKVLVHSQTVGAGIQNKLLEAMALGTPIVTTPVGASGIEGLEDGVHALIRSTDQELADATLMLLRDPARASELARNARALVETRYTWEHMFRALDQTIREIVPGLLPDPVTTVQTAPELVET